MNGDDDKKDEDAGDGAQSPQSESIPGPTYPHPDGMNDPKNDQNQ